MKRFALFVLVAFLLWCGVAPSQADKEAPRSPSRVAFVNVGKVLKRYSKAIQFKAVLGGVAAKHKKEADTLKRTIRDREKVRDDPMPSGGNNMRLDVLIRKNIARHDKLRAAIEERLRKLTDDHVVEM